MAFDDTGTLLATGGGQAVTVWSFQGSGPEGTRPGVLELHVEAVTQQWKDEKLNKSVQLTISGCLGPCDLANVFCVISPRGMQWFGGLQEQRQYGLLLDWANASRDAGVLLELPAELNRHRFERFAVGCGSCAERAIALIHKGSWQRTLRLRCAVSGNSVRPASPPASFGQPARPVVQNKVEAACARSDLFQPALEPRCRVAPG